MFVFCGCRCVDTIQNKEAPRVQEENVFGGYEEYHPTKFEWLLLQAEAYGTSVKLLDGQAEWAHFYNLSYSVGKGEDTIVICIEYRNPENVDQQMELKAEMTCLLERAYYFIASKKMTMYFPSLKIEKMLIEKTGSRNTEK